MKDLFVTISVSQSKFAVSRLCCCVTGPVQTIPLVCIIYHGRRENIDSTFPSINSKIYWACSTLYIIHEEYKQAERELEMKELGERAVPDVAVTVASDAVSRAGDCCRYISRSLLQTPFVPSLRSVGACAEPLALRRPVRTRRGNRRKCERGNSVTGSLSRFGVGKDPGKVGMLVGCKAGDGKWGISP